ncbi:MAG TPA: imidazole glycerol phosphate synthase subunit HisH [Polyangia bacterium]|nr:imidazole glycerol phosphate synthase subunit HisH [Polyangia bacterium]
MIGVLDYGMGNVRSVLNALAFLGATGKLVADAASAGEAERLILPGVGAFGAGMRRLDERGLAEALPGLVADGRPLLGVCLGMQLLADGSSEHGEHAGLGLIPGRVDRLEVAPLRIPHVGWNQIAIRRRSKLLEGLPEDPTFYFVHSYEFCPAEQQTITATTDYGRDVTAVVEDGAVLGAQFHPEKSQADGLQLLRNFLELEV